MVELQHVLVCFVFVFVFVKGTRGQVVATNYCLLLAISTCLIEENIE